MNKEQLNREIIACLKEQQKEYKYGGNAYNVLRKLETLIPNIVNESLKGEGEEGYLGYTKMRNLDGTVSVYHNGKDVSNQMLPYCVDVDKFNAIEITELNHEKQEAI